MMIRSIGAASLLVGAALALDPTETRAQSVGNGVIALFGPERVVNSEIVILVRTRQSRFTRRRAVGSSHTTKKHALRSRQLPGTQSSSQNSGGQSSQTGTSQGRSPNTGGQASQANSSPQTGEAGVRSQGTSQERLATQSSARALATVRIMNGCRQSAVVTVRYRPGSAAEVRRELEIAPGASRSIDAHVQWASGTYEYRSRQRSLRSSTRGGEILLETCR
jgi:hypothetical protein